MNTIPCIKKLLFSVISHIIIQSHIQRSYSNIYSCLLDVSKAFDRVHYSPSLKHMRLLIQSFI